MHSQRMAVDGVIAMAREVLCVAPREHSTLITMLAWAYMISGSGTASASARGLVTYGGITMGSSCAGERTPVERHSAQV